MQPRECVCTPAVFVYESFLLFFFYYLLLRILQCTFNLQYFSQYRVFALPLPWTLLPLLQHFSLRAVLAGQRAQKLGFLFIIPPFSAHTCFTFGIMFFSLCCFSFFFVFSNSGLSRVTLFCSLITPDTSMIFPAQHRCIKNELSHHCSCLFFLFHFRLSIPVNVSSLSVLLSKSLSISDSQFIYLFHLLLFVLKDAPFLAHRELFHE